MPNITIREKDLTSAGGANTTVNTVFIPGYAITGPINTPILCSTLDEFKSTFGSSPYVFRTQHTISGFSGADTPTRASINAGEFEKSYIYAYELLKLGLPVLYDRVFKEETTVMIEDEPTTVNMVEKWTASANIPLTTALENPPTMILSARYPGATSSTIHYSIISNSQTVNNKSYTYYVLSVGRDADVALKTTKINDITTRFTFSKELSDVSSIKLHSDLTTDESGLVNIEFENVSDVDALTIGDMEEPENLELEDDELSETDEFNIADIYTALGGDILTTIEDSGEFALKFITSGAYPTFNYNSTQDLAGSLIQCAANRGDCTALIDYMFNSSRSLSATESTSVYSVASVWAKSGLVTNSLGEDGFSYAALFTPYATYNCASVNKIVQMPASFGYLLALARSSQSYGNWMAVAGATRGVVPNLVALSEPVTNAIANSYQPRDSVSINPITNIKPYGTLIWGNRTLKNNALKGDLTATSFLNIRQLTNDVKRTVFVAAKKMTFEQNSDVLWINFKAEITPTLDKIVYGNGLSGYEIKRVVTTKKATIVARIRLYTVEAIEDFDITVELADSSTTVIG